MVQIPIIAIIGKLLPTSPHHRHRVKRQSKTVVSLIVLTFKHDVGSPHIENLRSRSPISTLANRRSRKAESPS
jgi:hypothetical protein